MRERYSRDRLLNLGLLLVVAVLIHAAYTFYVRPVANGWQAQERAKQAANPAYRPERSIWVVIENPEQETCIILGLWALGLAAMKVQALGKQRRQLDAELLRVPQGYRILPSDVREYSHKLEQLPPGERDLIPSRTIRRALKRFGETANVQDAATTVHDYCESEAARLDSELAVIRFCVWAIPAIGFVGTVRGISNALAGAQLALRGDTSAVTSGLGVSFNSTFVALIASIILMYVIHELQLRQERLVLDTELYVDDAVISNLQSR
ncbi:MAG TPA: MotA/TolQ/ExbB proton channel family protein [Steroidobacteraceae bacterium]|nr:MotA/TolQ/ExbB proton channel family protein [Steroidobacteraceae bacterium]